MPNETEQPNNTPASSSISKPEIELSFLIKLIPDKFDGDRFKIRSFVKQVDAVFEIAHESQTKALLLFVKSRICGKARDQIDIHCNLTTWEEISELLLNLYQDKKSLDQLLEELNSSQQEKKEILSQFFQRLEDLCSRTLAVIYASDEDDDSSKLAGRNSMIIDMTLNRFIYHCHPRISQMLRYRDFKTINEAFTAGLAEEKALRLEYNVPQINKKCNICHKNNHSTHECYKNKIPNQRPNNTKSINHVIQNKSCRYCKNLGHTIEECRKRQYNNNKRSNPNQNPNQTQDPQKYPNQ